MKKIIISKISAYPFSQILGVIEKIIYKWM